MFYADNDLYTYEALIQKPDMVGTIIGDNEIPRKSDGQEYMVKSTVNHFGINKSVVDTVEIYDVLKGSKAKVVEPSVIGSHTEKTAASLLNASDSTTTISIAELLETVKDNYPELLPDDVRRHFNIENAPKDLDIRYVAEGLPTEKEIVQRK